jgi:hypothetical protein
LIDRKGWEAIGRQEKNSKLFRHCSSNSKLQTDSIASVMWGSLHAVYLHNAKRHAHHSRHSTGVGTIYARAFSMQQQQERRRFHMHRERERERERERVRVGERDR